MHHRRILTAAMASVLSLSAAGSLHAAPLGIFHTAANKDGKAKMISFNVRNDSKQTLVLQAGDQQVTIQPGKVAALKLGEGLDLLNVNGSLHQAAGSVVTKVTKDLQGNTLAIS